MKKRPDISVEATRNGIGRSRARWSLSPPRPMPLRAPHLERWAHGMRIPRDPGRRSAAKADSIPF